MKEEEFLKKLGQEWIEISVCYSLDDDGNVLFDEESMTEDFEYALRGIRKILDGEDELKEIVKEKIKKIKNGNK